MNKFQKLAYKIAKNDINKEVYKNMKLKHMIRCNYAMIKNKSKWNYEKAKNFKNWSKDKEY